MKVGVIRMKGLSFIWRLPYLMLSVLFKPRELNLFVLDTHRTLLVAEDILRFSCGSVYHYGTFNSLTKRSA